MNILLTGFSDTSSEKILKHMDFPKLLLPNDKLRDTEIVLSQIKGTDLLFCFGQKPAIKNKLCVEFLAKKNENVLNTNFDIKLLENRLKENNLSFTWSQKPGKSFCNTLYYNLLEYVQSNQLSCKVIFLHVPFEKNIEDIQEFSKRLQQVIMALQN